MIRRIYCEELPALHTYKAVHVTRTRSRLLPLPFAHSASVKAAHISAFPEFQSATSFPRERWNALETFSPGVLIGYAYDLTRLAGAVERGALVLTTLDRAIYALTDCGTPVIDDALRHKLWRVFGVPVYELIVAPGCTLLAAECELHNGWHLQPDLAAHKVSGELVYDRGQLKNARTGFSGSLDAEPCECGRKTAALRNLRPFLRMQELPALALAS